MILTISLSEILSDVEGNALQIAIIIIVIATIYAVLSPKQKAEYVKDKARRIKDKFKKQ